MKQPEMIELIKSFDPDAEFLIPCAIEKDGSLSLTKNIRLEKGASDEFRGVDEQNVPEFEENQYVILMPGDGPWVEGKFNLPTAYS